MDEALDDTNDLKRHWTLDPGVDFLNHGSFGACPRHVQEAQQRLRDELERQPVRFFMRRFHGLLDQAREVLAAFLGADPDGLVHVTNATSGVNAVLRSLRFAPGDELLVTDHGYDACRNALEFVAERAGARVVPVRVPFPLESSAAFVDALLGAVTPRTKLALVDHVTSPTGLILPVAELVSRLAEAGVDCLVDGAHAPGMLPLNLKQLGAAYYTGNCHKWLCAPKGAAFLYVREDRRDRVRPLVIGHGASLHRPGHSAIQDAFDWPGTHDPTAFLCVPDSIRHMESLVEGGYREIRRRNRALALRGREILTAALGIAPPCPAEMIGSLVSLPLPDRAATEATGGESPDPLHDVLLDRHRIEVPVMPWPAPPRRLVRISAQLYNDESQYRRLAEALGRELR